MREREFQQHTRKYKQKTRPARNGFASLLVYFKNRKRTLVYNVWLVPLEKVVLCADDMHPLTTLLLCHDTTVESSATEHGLIVAELGDAVGHRLEVIVTPENFACLQVELELCVCRGKAPGPITAPSCILELRRSQSNAHDILQDVVQLMRCFGALKKLAQCATELVMYNHQTILGHVCRWQVLGIARLRAKMSKREGEGKEKE